MVVMVTFLRRDEADRAVVGEVDVLRMGVRLGFGYMQSVFSWRTTVISVFCAGTRLNECCFSRHAGQFGKARKSVH